VAGCTELTGSDTSEYVREEAGQMRRHGSVQVCHVCETRESGLMDGAQLAAR
jgi:hypothetical protein